MYSKRLNEISWLFTFGVILSIGIPSAVRAATVSILADYATIGVGDTILVSIALDTDGKAPNTVQGSVQLQDPQSAILLKDFTLADSAFPNWLKTPSLDDAQLISFIGGRPGGVNDETALIFKMVVEAQKEGKVVFTPENFRAFENDGKATAFPVDGKSFTLTIGPRGTEKNQWLEIISKDIAPPQNLEVVIGQDQFAFEGKKFLSISAVDDESGIDHFEVAEGNLPAIRSGNTYVLQDQDESSKIRVLAYDKAGNKSEVLLTPQTATARLWIWATLGLVTAVFIYGLFRYVRKHKKRQT